MTLQETHAYDDIINLPITSRASIRTCLATSGLPNSCRSRL